MRMRGTKKCLIWVAACLVILGTLHFASSHVAAAAAPKGVFRAAIHWQLTGDNFRSFNRRNVFRHASLIHVSRCLAKAHATGLVYPLPC